MKRFGVILSIFTLLVGLIGGCRPSFQPATYTDDMNRPVNITAVPQRIVSHVPSITETLFALGLGDRVVGRSDFDDYPPEVSNITSVGNYFNPSIEKIASLNPDLVLTDGHSDNIKQLDSLNITYMVIDPKTIDDVYKDIDLIGKVAGVENKAASLVAGMKNTANGVQNRAQNAPKIKVIYLLDATDLNNPWTAGPGSFVDAMIGMAGGENIAGGTSGAYGQMSIEQIIAADPDIIILPGQHGTAFTAPEVLKAHPAWQKTSAVKNNRIFIANADLIDRSGPRIVQGLEEIAKTIHPELYK
ncbi:MAG: cobalamin-binding protein [Dehalococcoidales bacterium]|nr:cobalamin-binding protein [Dehalococcoidales bacterium]